MFFYIGYYQNHIMRFKLQEHEIQLSLRVTIALVFSMLILLFGSVLIGYNYHKNKSIALLAAEDLSININARATSGIKEIYTPVRQFVDIGAASSPVMPSDIAEMLHLADYFGQALKLNPGLSSIYLANQDGNFFAIRNLAVQQASRLSRRSPTNAQFVVQLILRKSQQKTLEVNLFLNKQLEQLGSEFITETSYDHRQRDWYQTALNSSEGIVSDFYVFFSTKETGITLAHKLPNNQAVVAANITLKQLSADLAAQDFSPSAEILLTDKSGQIIAHATGGQVVIHQDQKTPDRVQLSKLQNLDQGLYIPISNRLHSMNQQATVEFEHQGQLWLAYISAIPSRSIKQLYLTTMAPARELLAGVAQLRNESALISLVLLLLAVLVSIRVSRLVSTPIQQLSSAAERIREFKLDTPVHVSSHILEVDNLSQTMSMMQNSINHFLTISIALSAEKDFSRLLQLILQEAMTVSHAQAGAILLTSEDEQHVECVITSNMTTGQSFGGANQPTSRLPPYQLLENDLDSHVIRSGKSLLIDNLDDYQDLDTHGVEERFRQNGYQATSLLSVPLINQKNESIGLIQLTKAARQDGSSGAFNPTILSYIEALSSDAAVALDNRRLLKSEEDLLDAFIQVLAGAIDAKSPYTGGHCQRVPELARMLSEAAMDSNEDAFADFTLSQEEQRQLHIASWLHDCGKVTTPEHVVDKATRLETLYNRIHEIRMRFEVLWRDAEISYLQARLENQDTADNLHASLQQRLDNIRDDFDFVGNCNLGSTFMDEDKLQRLQAIGNQTWLRQLDDRPGLSAEEASRMPENQTTVLPVMERILMDRSRDLIPWPTAEGTGDMDKFTLNKPENAYNRGELHNLGISRGTLTEEERYKINEHVIQTLRMLRKMPFPKGLRQVPDWAGNHHEQMNGGGYPRSLGAGALSIPERIMAIADIFEALTASDRPYKSAKSLDQSLRIMQEMSDRGHICPDLFRLFVSSGVYRLYGGKYLQPEQLDETDS